MPADIEGLLKYVELTNLPLLRLVDHICGSGEHEEILRKVAVNYGLAGILRSHTYHKARGFDLLPAGCKPADVAAQFVSVKPGLPVLKAFQGLADIYIRQVKSLQYDLSDPRLRFDPPFKALRLLMKTRLF